MTIETNNKKICPQNGCSFSTTGICMNGNLPALTCPNIKEIIENEIYQSPSEEVISGEDNPLVFHVLSGQDLSESEIPMITYQFPNKLIVLVGEPECGKSTLYASLFDLFHKGGVDRYFFSGTKTPISFERRCHDARMISQNVTSKTERTKAYEFKYLHLAVRDKTLMGPIKHLLFGDVNGEKFQRARESDDEMKTLTIFNKASQIFFVVDGEALIDKGKRHALKGNVISMFDRMLQNNMLPSDKKIHILINKWDIVHAANEENGVDIFFTQQILKKYGSIIDEVLIVAARSQNPEFPAGKGLDKFLQICLSENYRVGSNDSVVDIKREFQKFKYSKINV